jgi:CTP:phosphocholine cytidylyltransferase-like protein
MSREEYQKETLKGWSMTSDNEYSRENEEIIKISDDGQVAVVETDVIESYVMQGRTIHTTTHERVTLQIIDGEILVTRIDAFMRM